MLNLCDIWVLVAVTHLKDYVEMEQDTLKNQVKQDFQMYVHSWHMSLANK